MKNRVLGFMAATLLCSAFAHPILAEAETESFQQAFERQKEAFDQALKRQIEEKVQNKINKKRTEYKQDMGNRLLRTAAYVALIAQSYWTGPAALKYEGTYPSDDLPDIPPVLVPIVLSLGGFAGVIYEWMPPSEKEIRHRMEVKLAEKSCPFENRRSFSQVYEKLNDADVALGQLIQCNDNLSEIKKALQSEGFEFTDAQWVEFEALQAQVNQCIKENLA